jgi:DNA mismatch repair protein MSH5
MGDANASCADDQFRLPYVLEIRPSAEFNYEPGRSKLVNLRLDSDDGPTITFTIPNDVLGAEGHDLPGDFTGRQENLLRLGGWIDVESRITVCLSCDLCKFSMQNLILLGGLCRGFDILFTKAEGRWVLAWRPRGTLLLSYFQPRDVFAQRLHVRLSFHTAFKSANVSRFINSDTLQSLQIIQTESHPNSHNQGPNSYGAKEGLSVYGLFHHLARTPQGRHLLRQYFLRPSLSLTVINERLDAIAIFIRPDNATQLNDLVKELRSIKNMRPVMLNLQKGVSASKGGISTSAWSTVLRVGILFLTKGFVL